MIVALSISILIKLFVILCWKNGEVSSQFCVTVPDMLNFQMIGPGLYETTDITASDWSRCLGECFLAGVTYSAIWKNKYCFCINDLNGLTNFTGDCLAQDGFMIEKSISQMADHVFQMTTPSANLEYNISNSAVSFTPNQLFLDPNMAIGYKYSYSDREHIWEYSLDNTPLKRQFLRSGIVEIFAESVKAVNKKKITQIGFEMLLYSIPASMNLTCDPLAILGKFANCYLEVISGSSLKSDISVDGSLKETFNIPDSPWERFGNPVNFFQNDFLTGQSNTGVYLIGDEFQFEGVVTHVETLSTLKLMIVKPVCSNYFCLTQRACSTDVMCSSTRTCPNGMCSITRSCSDACSDSSLLNFVNSTLVTNDFIVVTKEDIAYTSGVNIYKLANPVPVYPGYRLAVFGAANSIKYTVNRHLEASDIFVQATEPNVGATLVLSSATRPNIRHQVSALIQYNRMTKIKLLFNTTGTKSVEVKVKSSQAPAQILTQTASIIVGYNINDTSLNLPHFALTNERKLFQLQPHTGDNLKYYWVFGNGQVANTTESAVNYTYPTKGKYNMSVISYNTLTSGTQSVELTVIDRLAIANISGNRPSNPNTPVIYTISFTSGSDYNCTLSGDGISSNITIQNTNELTAQWPSDHYYRVTLYCFNALTSDIRQWTQIIISNITGLSFEKLGDAYNEDISIEFKWDTGVNITFEMMVNNITRAVTYNQTTRIGKSEIFKILVIGNVIGVLRAINPMSDVILVGNLTFSERVVNLRIVPSLIHVKLGDPILFQVMMDKGSSMKLIFKFGEGDNSNQTLQLAIDERYNNHFSRNYTFANVGQYNASVITENTASTESAYVVVSVFTSLGQYSVNQPIQYVKINQDCSISLTRTSGEPASVTNLTIKWADGSSDLFVPSSNFNESMVILHKFAALGTYNLSIVLRNPVSQVDLLATIYVIVPITNFRCQLIPPNTWINNPIQFNLLLDSGSNVQLTLNPDATPIQSNFINEVNAVNTKRIFSHSYSAVQTYAANISACNQLGCQFCNPTIQVQYKIIRTDFTVTSGGFVEKGQSSVVNIVWSGTQFPSNITLTIVYPFGMPTESSLTPQSAYPYNKIFVFTQMGKATINVTLSNLITVETYIIEIGAFEKFVAFQVSIRWGPSRSEGFGALKNRYPVNQDLYFKPAVGSKGTIDRYEFFWALIKNPSDIYHCNVTLVNGDFSYKFTKTGDFNVSMLAINPIDQSVAFQTIVIGGSMKDMKIVPPERNVLPKSLMPLSVVWTAIDTSACICIDFANGTKNIYGATKGCTNCSANYVYTNIKPINNILEVLIYYPKEGDYNIKVLVTNEFEMATTNHTVPVTYVECSVPIVQMTVNSYTVSETPQIGQRGTQIIVESKIVDIPCKITKNNYKKWSAQEVDAEYFKPLRVVDLSAIETNNNTQLIIPPRFFAYGLYKLTFTVTMDTNKTVYSFINYVSSYLKITNTPVVVSLSQGGINLFFKGIKSTICFYPEKYSIDPDLNVQNFNNWTWIWTCREESETIPNDTSIVKVPKPSGHTYTLPKTGCFGDGPGRVNFTNNNFCFWGENMDINKNYEFELTGRAGDGRNGSSKVTVQVVFGEPPDINIQCMRPKLCKIKTDGEFKYQEISFNPSDDLLINSSCKFQNLPCTNGTWELILYNNTNKQWNTPLENSVANLYMKGMESNEMALLSSFWVNYAAYNRFKACYSAQTSKNVVGRSCIQLYVVPLPSDVSCTVNTTVIKQTDQLCVHCNSSNKYDYRIYVNNSGQLITLGFNDSGIFCSIIPYSETKQEYRVRVTNDNGGFIDIKVADIQVGKLSDNEMNTILKNLEQGKDQELEIVNAKGDFKKMSEIYLKYVSVITVSSQNTMMNIFGSATNNSKQSYGGTDYNSKIVITEKVMTIDDLSVEKRQIFENDRDSKSDLINKMTKNLKEMVPGDIKSLYLISGVIESICTTFDNVNRRSQGEIANKLVHLSLNLQTMASTAPRDDVQKIAQSILSATILTDTASNSQITRGIKRDIKEAKDNFLDYDTSLQSASNSYMSVSDPSKASQSLTLETNSNYQSKVASGIKSNNIYTVSSVTKILRDISVIDDKPVELNSNQMQYLIQKTRPNALSNKIFNKGRSEIKLPDICSSFNLNATQCNKEPFAIEILATPNNVRAFNPSPNGPGLPIPSDSETVTINMYLGNSNSEKEMNKMENKKTFDLFISRDPTMTRPAFNISDPKVPEPRIAQPRAIPGTGNVLSGTKCYYQRLVMHEFTLTGSDQSVHFQISPNDTENVCPQYLIVGRLARPPVLGETPYGTLDKDGYDFYGMLPHLTKYCTTPTTSNEPDPYSFFVSNYKFQMAKKKAFDTVPDYSSKRNTLYFGIRQLRQDERDKYVETSPPPLNYSYIDQINVSYTTMIFSTGCYHTNEKANGPWSTSGCVVGPLTTTKRTHCICNHLTSFAGGWIVAPNTIDFEYVFANFDFTKNMTLFITEIVVFIVFALIMLWARRQDIRDIAKIGVTPLKDNDPDDIYLYELVVDTSIRNGSGTDSNVCFILSGEYDETEARKLEDDKRPILKRGNVDRFLMAVPRSLGNLQYIRLWHDNSGKGSRASWCCNYFGVTDLQTKEKFHFLVNRWFAVEEDDGQIDRLIAVASVEELLNFGEVFTRKMKSDFSENHLWLSIMARPPESRFTRLERVACCLLLLFLTMLTTCMFYESEGPAKKETSIITIGPFALTPKEVWTGLISNLIAFIPLFLIIELFRKSALKHGHANKLRQVVEDHLGEELATVQTARTTTDSTVNLKNHEARPDTPGYRAPDQVSVQIVDIDDTAVSPPAKKFVRRRLLPWWVRIITWCILAMLLVVAVVFTTFYGIQFGDEACKKWISSLFISFFSSVLLTQPIKVILLAMFFSLVCRKANKLDEIEFIDEEDELMNELGQRNGLNQNEEFLHGDLYNEPVRPNRSIIQPPLKEDVEKAREIRLREMKMFDVLREILFYVIFFTTMLLVTYSLRDPNSFQLKTQLENVFTKSIKGEFDFDKIKKEDQFWDWGINVLVPALRAPKWYNNDPQLFQRGFTSDRNNRLIGFAVLRQLRVKKNTCEVYSYVRNLINECYSPYSFTNEDTANYSREWGSYNDEVANNPVDRAYVYRKASELDGLPYMGRITYYSGGGYVHEFNGSAQKIHGEFLALKESRWIDAQTRAIFVEFTTYNPNVNLFAVNTFLLELPGSGGIWASYRVEPANLLGMYSSGVAAFEIFCQVLYGVFIIAMIVKEVRNLIKQKCSYFTQFWNLCEVFLIGGSFACVAAFAYVKIATSALTDKFNKYGGIVYIKFQYVAFWNEYLSYLVSFIVFVATLKFIRLLRFNKRMGMLGAVLRYSAKDMKQFFIIFAIMFLAFVMVFYSLFMDSLYRYHTFLHATEASMQIALGKFEFLELYQKEPIFGPIVFAFYVIFIIFVMLNMFIAILNEGFAVVRADIELQDNDYELVEFITTKLIVWTGISQTKIGQKLIKTGVTDQVYRDYDTRQMAAKVNSFPEKVDQLLNHINRIITTGDNVNKTGNTSRSGGHNSQGDNKSFSSILFESTLGRGTQKSRPKVVSGDEVTSYDNQAAISTISRSASGSSNVLRQRISTPVLTPIEK